jgi:hypothetical protein
MRSLYESTGRYRNLCLREDIPQADWLALPGVVEQLAWEVIKQEGALRSPVWMGGFVCWQPKSDL